MRKGVWVDEKSLARSRMIFKLDFSVIRKTYKKILKLDQMLAFNDEIFLFYDKNYETAMY